ncbi:MAG: TIGR00296 family protein [Methanobrevibacter sp.]|jgi:uncharacterized protein (TIGR00296 family)|nr:TIGR00296 family protein [Methanobrevibacter sp.]
MLSEKDGEFLINLAKEAITKYTKNYEIIETPKDVESHLNENLGVFVTLNKNKNLRGCIGYPEPVYPLLDAIINSAIAAAHEDPRFPSLKEEELKDIEIEVTVLTKPELIEVKDPKEYPSKITIGKDGLIIKKGYNSGLLLPQVATEHNMDNESFLENTCQKAGLNPNCWLEEDTEIYSFQGQIFHEK